MRGSGAVSPFILDIDEEDEPLSLAYADEREEGNGNEKNESGGVRDGREKGEGERVNDCDDGVMNEERESGDDDIEGWVNGDDEEAERERVEGVWRENYERMEKEKKELIEKEFQKKGKFHSLEWEIRKELRTWVTEHRFRSGVCVFVCFCVYVYVCVCMYVYVYVCVCYVFMCAHPYTRFVRIYVCVMLM